MDDSLPSQSRFVGVGGGSHGQMRGSVSRRGVAEALDLRRDDDRPPSRGATLHATRTSPGYRDLDEVPVGRFASQPSSALSPVVADRSTERSGGGRHGTPSGPRPFLKKGR